jgi:uncharacterized protein YecE (DUF72 family)
MQMDNCAMPGEIRVGTSGWNYPTGRGTWNGVFYPAHRKARFDELAWYAAHFDTVEVNSTFYRMPEAPMTARWVERTPADFLFSVKLFQKFTHPDMYLARAGVSDWNLSTGDIDAFHAGIRPLAEAGRLAALLMQFPPSFHAIPETRDYLDWLMRAFAPHPLVVELRHKSWDDDAGGTHALIAGGGASRVLIDDPFTHIEGAARPNPETPEPSLMYLRLHGRNRAAWWEHDASEDRYNYLYSPEELEPVAEIASEAAAAGRRVLVYLNNHFSAKAVANAAVLKSRLGHLLPGEYPAEMVERYPDLTSIVTTPPSLL